MKQPASSSAYDLELEGERTADWSPLLPRSSSPSSPSPAHSRRSSTSLSVTGTRHSRHKWLILTAVAVGGLFALATTRGAAEGGLTSAWEGYRVPLGWGSQGEGVKQQAETEQQSEEQLVQPGAELVDVTLDPTATEPAPIPSPFPSVDLSPAPTSLSIADSDEADDDTEYDVTNAPTPSSDPSDDSSLEASAAEPTPRPEEGSDRKTILHANLLSKLNVRPYPHPIASDEQQAREVKYVSYENHSGFHNRQCHFSRLSHSQAMS